MGTTYFRNEVKHIRDLGHATSIILNLDNSLCKKIDHIINEAIKHDSEKPINSVVPDIANFLGDKERKKTQDFLKVLYYDYKESREVYSNIYGNDNFSIIHFLQFSNIKYADERTRLLIENKIKSLNNDTLKNVRMASYGGVDVDGLSNEEIEEIKQFVEFIRNKKKK